MDEVKFIELMNYVNLDLSLEEISKIDKGVGLDISIKDNQVTKCEFKITEYKRFYTQAIRVMKSRRRRPRPCLGPHLLALALNAHILASLEAIERPFSSPFPNHDLRRLLMNGLIIRDHALLHLYLFASPDLFNKDSISRL